MQIRPQMAQMTPINSQDNGPQMAQITQISYQDNGPQMAQMTQISYQDGLAACHAQFETLGLR